MEKLKCVSQSEILINGKNFETHPVQNIKSAIEILYLSENSNLVTKLYKHLPVFDLAYICFRRYFFIKIIRI